MWQIQLGNLWLQYTRVHFWYPTDYYCPVSSTAVVRTRSLVATAQHRVSGILGFLIHNRLGSVRKNYSMKTGEVIQIHKIGKPWKKRAQAQGMWWKWRRRQQNISKIGDCIESVYVFLWHLLLFVRSFSCSKEIKSTKENCQKDREVEDSEVVCYSDGNLEDHYDIGPIIGKGGYGTVYIGQRKKNKEKVILKHIPKWKILQTNEVIINEWMKDDLTKIMYKYFIVTCWHFLGYPVTSSYWSCSFTKTEGSGARLDNCWLFWKDWFICDSVGGLWILCRSIWLYQW